MDPVVAAYCQLTWFTLTGLAMEEAATSARRSSIAKCLVAASWCFPREGEVLAQALAAPMCSGWMGNPPSKEYP